jgi:hypothetical protein
MTTAYTSLLGLALPVTGELSGTWGDTVNNSITSLLDTSVAGTTNVSTDTDVTLTTTTGAANTARQAILLFSGARTALRTVTAPAQSKVYTVINATTGGFSVKLVGVGPTTGVTIVAGESAVCAWNGSDFIKISNTGGSASFTNVTVTGTTTLSGLTASTALALDASKNVVSVTNTGTGNNVLSASPTLTGTIGAASLTLSTDLTLSGGTANGVAYLNGSKVVTSGSALVFDGTRFGVGSAPNSGYNASFISQVGADTGTGGLMIRGADGYLSFDSGVAGFGTTGIYGNAGGGTSANSYLVFRQNASEQMRLTSTGLGIGTSSPLAKLQSNNSSSGATALTAIFSNSASAALNNGSAIFLNNSSSFNASAYSARIASVITNASTQTSDLIFGLYNGSQGNDLMRLDSSGNLGLGVTPSAWGSTFKAIQGGGGTVVNTIAFQNNDYVTNVASNWYYDGANDKYVTSAGASRLRVGAGGATAGSGFTFQIAGSGTGGANLTWTSAATIDTSGNFMVGTTTIGTGNRMNVVGNNVVFSPNTAGKDTHTFSTAAADVGTYVIKNDTTTNVQLHAGGVSYFNGGNVGIGTSSPQFKLDVYRGSSGVVLNLDGENAYNAETGIALSSGRAKISGFLNGTGGTPGASLRFYTMPDGGSVTERVRIDSNGNFGIGTSSPSSILQLNAATPILTFNQTTGNSNQGMQFQGNGTTYGRITNNQITGVLNISNGNAPADGYSIAFSTDGSERGRFAFNGNFGVGTSSPATKLDVRGTSNTAASTIQIVGESVSSLLLGQNADGGVIRGQGGNNALTFWTGGLADTGAGQSGTERARIDSSGNFVVGSTSFNAGVVGFGAAPNGDVYMTRSETTNSYVTNQIYSTGAAVYRFYVGMAGTVYAASTSISAISDQTLKENIRDLETGLAEVMALKPRRFDWKNGDALNVAGFIAQEVEQVLPELVSDYKYSDTETKKSLKMGDILPTLVKAIQEQQAIIESLKARLDAANL